MDSPTSGLWAGPFPIEGMSGWFCCFFFFFVFFFLLFFFCLFFLSFLCFVESSVFNANSVDPDQMPRSAASDLGLNCLPMSLLWVARHKSVLYKEMHNVQIFTTIMYRM